MASPSLIASTMDAIATRRAALGPNVLQIHRAEPAHADIGIDIDLPPSMRAVHLAMRWMSTTDADAHADRFPGWHRTNHENGTTTLYRSTYVDP